MTIQRRTPLARSTKPIRKVSKKRAKLQRETDWDALTHHAVTEQEGRCIWCDYLLGDNFARHHVKLRSQGGQHTEDNIVAVHHACHDFIHAHPDAARARGLYGAKEHA